MEKEKRDYDEGKCNAMPTVHDFCFVDVSVRMNSALITERSAVKER